MSSHRTRISSVLLTLAVVSILCATTITPVTAADRGAPDWAKMFVEQAALWDDADPGDGDTAHDPQEDVDTGVTCVMAGDRVPARSRTSCPAREGRGPESWSRSWERPDA